MLYVFALVRTPPAPPTNTPNNTKRRKLLFLTKIFRFHYLELNDRLRGILVVVFEVRAATSLSIISASIQFFSMVSKISSDHPFTFTTMSASAPIPKAKGIKRGRIDESPAESNTLTLAEKVRLYHGKRAREDNLAGNGRQETKMPSSLTRIPLAEVLRSPAATRGFLGRATTTPITASLKARKFQRTTLAAPNYPTASSTKPTSFLLSSTSNTMTKEKFNACADRFESWIHDAVIKAKQAISNSRLDILRENRERPKEDMRRILEDRECERREERYREEQERIRLWQEEQLQFFAECRKRRDKERANMFEWKEDDDLVRVVENGSCQSSM
ncbi:hypothetical protein RUND412_000439 [Rhizina undulata]